LSLPVFCIPAYNTAARRCEEDSFLKKAIFPGANIGRLWFIFYSYKFCLFSIHQYMPWYFTAAKKNEEGNFFKKRNFFVQFFEDCNFFGFILSVLNICQDTVLQRFDAKSAIFWRTRFFLQSFENYDSFFIYFSFILFVFDMCQDTILQREVAKSAIFQAPRCFRCVLQCVAVCHSVLQYVAVCCSVL